MSMQAAIPAPLRNGDRIAIVSPSGTVKEEFVHDAAAVLEAQGWRPYIGKHALGKVGTFSGTADERFADLSEALLEPSVRAVFCARGGYGAVHLLERLAKLPLAADPKWLIGYSDISALHALMHSKGVASIHGPMAKHLSTFGGEDDDAQALFRTLRGEMPSFSIDSHPFNHPGYAKGPIIGGNLAVIMGLLSTPYDVVRPHSILFVEDISEPVYKVERQFYQLHLSGALSRIKGLVLGQFTEYSPDINHESMESMIEKILRPYRIPVVFNAPIGHVDHNVPVVSGAIATLSVDSTRSQLSYL